MSSISKIVVWNGLVWLGPGRHVGHVSVSSEYPQFTRCDLTSRSAEYIYLFFRTSHFRQVINAA